MFCPNCGTTYADEAAFCYKCGKELPKEQATPASPPRDLSNPVAERTSTKRRTWITIVIVFLLFSMYSQIIVGAFSGVMAFTKAKEQVYVVVTGGWFFWWLFKNYGYNKSVGCVFGLFLSFCILVAGTAINKQAKSSIKFGWQAPVQSGAMSHHDVGLHGSESSPFEPSHG